MDKMDKKNITQKSVNKELSQTLTIAVIAVILLGIALYYISTAYIPKSTDLNLSGGNTTGPITEQTEVCQTFIAEEDRLSSVGIYMSTYARLNSSNYTFSLTDSDGNTLFYRLENSGAISDNTYYTLSFSKIKNSKGKQYTVKIVSESDEINAVAAMTSEEDAYPGGALIINGEDTGLDLVFRVSYGKHVTIMAIPVVCAIIAVLLLILYNARSMKKKASLKVKIAFWLVFSAVIAIIASEVYTVWLYNLNAYSSFSYSFTVGLFRAMLFQPVILAASAFLFFDCKKTADFIFKRRWWIALAVFVIMFANKMTLSNVSAFSRHVQPNSKTEYTEPIFGLTRIIRSDEWMVDLPRKVSAEYVDYGDENYLVRGTYNTGLAASGLQKGYSALANPLNWGYYLFGSEYGSSFYWMSLFILTVMTSFELCYIISNKSRLTALFGGAAIGLSQYILWWSIIHYFFCAEAIVVCAYYYFDAKKRSHKILLALAVAFSGACFISALYPAFQVPMGYIVLAMLIWVVKEKFDSVKKMGKESLIIMALAFAFMVSIVVAFLRDNQFYMQGVMNTVYPGQRRSSGGYFLNKVMDYFHSLILPFKSVATSNNSEVSITFNLFPLPLILSLYTLVRQIMAKRKNKSVKIDVLNITLLAVCVLFLAYNTVGIPDWLARITLLDYSVPYRCVDYLGVAMMYLIVRLLKKPDGDESCKLSEHIGMVLSAATVLLGILFSVIHYPETISAVYIIAVGGLVFFFCYALCCNVSERFKKIVVASFTAVVAISGLCVLPVTRGLDALLKTPVAEEIREISEQDPDAIWVAYDEIVLNNYIIANGGKCITSINYIPNMELWRSLDEEGVYDEIYNRFAHIRLKFTPVETHFEPESFADGFVLALNGDDLEKCGIDYILTLSQLDSPSPNVALNNVYSKDGIYIYKVNYINSSEASA